MSFLSLSTSELAVPKLHEYLLSAVAPRPIAFVSTLDKEGRNNLAPFSFFNVFGANPPTLIFSPARSGRTGATKNTHDNVLEIPECVVNIAHYEILYQMNLAAHMFAKGIDEFAKSGLTKLQSVTVRPPRVAECFVQMECKVKNVIETGQGGGAGNLIICEVTMLHIHKHVLDGEGSIDPFKMNYIARMGKQYWCRVRAENIITVPPFKMGDELGIGWDALPTSITRSKYLTANDVAQVAALHAFPTQESLAELREADFVKEIFATHSNHPQELLKALHLRAKTEIERGSLMLAFKLLMIADKVEINLH
ncbi:MAG: flavin reductase family protein [Chitinophagales bacterium]|nr:flavin reductase family protein [Chitinophagales bacterium]MDW8419419.1 flavin reductase family protein [Chitinophagales bacterium]